jgi:hypothetical protein
MTHGKKTHQNILGKYHGIICRICKEFPIATNMFLDIVCNRHGITLRHVFLHACPYSKYTLYLSKISFFSLPDVCCTCICAHFYAAERHKDLYTVYIYMRNGSNRVRIHCQERRKKLPRKT